MYMCDIVSELWSVNFEVTSPLKSLPRILSLHESAIRDSRYRWNASLHQSHQAKNQTLFQFTLRGCGAFDDGKEVHPLPPGTGFLTNLHDRRYRYFYPEEGEGELIVLWCMFDSPATRELTEEINRRYGYLFELAAESRIISTLRKLGSTGRSHMTMTATENAQLASEVLYTLIWSKERQRSVKSEEALITRALALLEKGQGVLYNAGELADALEVSREHLGRVFTSQLGISPYRYIILGKVERAKTILKGTSTPIGQIAYELGFSSPLHFSQLFKKHTGISPRDYRRTYRGG